MLFISKIFAWLHTYIIIKYQFPTTTSTDCLPVPTDLHNCAMCAIISKGTLKNYVVASANKSNKPDKSETDKSIAQLY